MTPTSSIRQRRYAEDFGRNANTMNKKVRVLTTTPAITPGSTPRFRESGATEYGRLLTTELQQNAPRNLAAAVITLGETEKDIAAESSYYNACADAFVNTKLRELMTALLSGLCGVPHPNTALPDGLFPRTHFIDWLRGAFSDGTRVFDPEPQPGPNPLQPRLALNENVGNPASPVNGNPGKPTLTTGILPHTAAITGKASKLHFREIVIMFETLGQLAPQANEVVHSLTISDVVRVLLHPITPLRIKPDALNCLVVLVESIIGCTIQDVTLDWDSQLARKQFKAAARDFRRKIPETMLLAKIEKDWKGKWQVARAEDLMQDLINRKLVVTVEEHEVVKKELAETKKELVRVEEAHDKSISILMARLEKVEQRWMPVQN